MSHLQQAVKANYCRIINSIRLNDVIFQMAKDDTHIGRHLQTELESQHNNIKLTNLPGRVKLTTQSKYVGPTIQHKSVELNTHLQPKSVESTTHLQPNSVEITTHLQPNSVEISTQPKNVELSSQPNSSVELTTQPPGVELTTEFKSAYERTRLLIDKTVCQSDEIRSCCVSFIKRLLLTGQFILAGAIISNLRVRLLKTAIVEFTEKYHRNFEGLRRSIYADENYLMSQMSCISSAYEMKEVKALWRDKFELSDATLTALLRQAYPHKITIVNMIVTE